MEELEGKLDAPLAAAALRSPRRSAAAPARRARAPSSFFIVPILPGCSMISCLKVPIQSLSLFAPSPPPRGRWCRAQTAARP